ncbi:MAG: lactococcin 972 family bacteriocin [Anaerovoracaceae bacterium]
MKKIFMCILATMMIIVGTATVFAETSNVSGGTWIYGITTDAKGNQKTVYSNFDHSKKTHSSSVINYAGDKYSSGKVAKGKVSKASLPAGKGTDSSFYNVY